MLTPTSSHFNKNPQPKVKMSNVTTGVSRVGLAEAKICERQEGVRSRSRDQMAREDPGTGLSLAANSGDAKAARRQPEADE